MVKSSFNNPFISCTARDMSYSDVMRFWCSPFECYKINESDLNSSVTPIIIEGARGSGKTMILKRLSFFCQKENFASNKVIEGISNAGYLGIYFRYSADYSSLFDALNCSKMYRERLFEGYFQMGLCLELIHIIHEIENELCEEEKNKLLSNISAIVGEYVQNFEMLIKWIERNIRKQDEIIRKSQYLSVDENMDGQQVVPVFDIIDAVQSSVSAFRKVLFIIIIDEFENIGAYQRVINTYIKQMEGKNGYTFRIGVRPEGIRDYTTNVAGEFLQDGRDYIKKQLIVSSDDRTANYSRFVKSVINTRLNMVPIFNQSGIEIDTLLGKKEDYEWEANYHVKGRKEHFSEAFLDKTELQIKEISDVIMDDNPIVEAYFLMRLKRGESLADISKMKNENLQKLNTENTKKYRLDMRDKYKASLLFWLIDKYKAKYNTKKLYYSFSTYLYLSCGSIYDFIGLCRTVFDELESDYFVNFESNPEISPIVQSRAAQKYAESQLEKVRINHDYGPQMYQFVKNMCDLFGYYHKGDLCTTYPETNQFYVSGNFDSTGVNKEIWSSLLRWGVIIKKTSFQRATLSISSKAQLYYVNKSYYPIFGISCRIRGGFNYALTNDVWDNMITTIVDPATLVKGSVRRKKEINGQVKKNSGDDIDKFQMSLFDVEGFDE